MTANVILYTNIPGGGVCVTMPTPDALACATIDQIAEKDVPAGSPYWIVPADTIPADRTFREAWELPADMPEPAGYGSASSVFPEEVLS